MPARVTQELPEDLPEDSPEELPERPPEKLLEDSPEKPQGPCYSAGCQKESRESRGSLERLPACLPCLRGGDCCVVRRDAASRDETR